MNKNLARGMSFEHEYRYEIQGKKFRTVKDAYKYAIEKFGCGVGFRTFDDRLVAGVASITWENLCAKPKNKGGQGKKNSIAKQKEEMKELIAALDARKRVILP